jgi:two-component sensor histidine kinase
MSVEGGSLAIRWVCSDNVLVLKWEESGGPRIAGPPHSEGFGTRLSNHSVRFQLGGAVTHQWYEAGLAVELSVPLERLEH